MLEVPEGVKEYRMKIDIKLLSLRGYSPDTNQGENLLILILTNQRSKKSKDDVIFSAENPLEQY